MINTDSFFSRYWLIHNSAKLSSVLLAACILLSICFHTLYILDIVSLKYDAIEPEKIISKKPTNILKEDDYPMIFGQFSGKNRTSGSILETRLKLTLMGTLMDRNKAASSVIIQGSDGISKVYKIGDHLEDNGAILADIYPKHVILFYEGSRQKLSYSEGEAFLSESPSQQTGKNLRPVVPVFLQKTPSNQTNK